MPSDAIAAGVDVISHSHQVVVETMEKVPQRYAESQSLLDYSAGVESKPISELLELMLRKKTILDPS
ncbi:MAG: hypothetical protein ACREBC_11205, partial [Pyrinomonadaceae bacterium]